MFIVLLRQRSAEKNIAHSKVQPDAADVGREWADSVLAGGGGGKVALDQVGAILIAGGTTPQREDTTDSKTTVK